MFFLFTKFIDDEFQERIIFNDFEYIFLMVKKRDFFSE